MLSAASAHAGASRVGNDYYEDIFPVKTCNNTSGCAAPSSAATPSGLYTRMRHFYCSIAVGSNGFLYLLQAEVWTAPPGTSGATLIKAVPLTLPQPVSFVGINFYNMNQDILLSTGPGRYVVFDATATGSVPSISLTCAITGDLIPSPQ
jgi:hypothetical protein